MFNYLDLFTFLKKEIFPNTADLADLIKCQIKSSSNVLEKVCFWKMIRDKALRINKLYIYT